MKLFPPIVLRGDFDAAKNHRGVPLIEFPGAGRHSFVMSGVFVGQSNHLRIMSMLRSVGFVPRTTVNHTTAMVVYSSDIDAEAAMHGTMPGKLAAAVNNGVPFILNEAAACDVLGIIFNMPKDRRELMLAQSAALSKEPSDPQKQTGRSSRLALGYILEAWSHQGRVVGIVDHFPTSRSDVDLAHRVRDMIEQMGLRGFTVDRTPNSTSVVFNGY
jgi:hypothetical protein